MSPARTSKDLRRPNSVQALRLDRSEGCVVEALSGEQANPRRLIKYSDLLGADVVAPSARRRTRSSCSRGRPSAASSPI